MTANQDAASAILTQMGISVPAMPDALAATESVVEVFRTPHTPGLTSQWECAAEFVGTYAAITGATGSALRQSVSLARAAYKLQRY